MRAARASEREPGPVAAMAPPAPTVRRALAAAAWLLVVLAGLLAAVWGVAWALEGGPQPSADAVEEAVHLTLPDGTDVIDADLSQAQPPMPGDRAEATIAVPAEAFGEFIDGNGMDAPLLAGVTPAGTASGVIPAGCTDEVCYAATIIVTEDAVEVRLTVTLI
ncbi:hypothetical protein GCM10009853_077360 [Glycomyces scopariae]|uniref:Uncharacterized protein n=1 Tax=Glycomyces sambucus TaxID=380244 RepID=A0A1G9F796_9ACTN|nr:hypothetical protein [Glycomyces sambucus]SDK84258.1 hypothetical protein SAMN05216298_1622 [Glycomyces sambucus]